MPREELPIRGPLWPGQGRRINGVGGYFRENEPCGRHFAAPPGPWLRRGERLRMGPSRHQGWPRGNWGSGDPDIRRIRK